LTVNSVIVSDNSTDEKMIPNREVMQFNSNDVLGTKSEKTKRLALLLQAITMESISPTEVIIFTEMSDYCCKFTNRIIAAGDEKILLDDGKSIPINSIHKIEFLQN